MINGYSEIDLNSKSVNEKIDIIEAIGRSKVFSKKKIKTLDYLSQDDDDEVRAKVAEILVISDPMQAEEILTRLLMDEEELVRVNACDSLGASNSLEVLNLLKNIILKDKSSLVRGYAALSIADIASNINYNMEELSGFFRRVLVKEKNNWVKINFYKALYMLGNKSYLDMLIKELNNRLYRNRSLIVNYLIEILSNENTMIIKSALNERLKVEKTVAVRSSIEKVLKSLKEK